MDEQQAFQIECRVWINSNNESFLGKGRITLLKNIQHYGSISKAAKEMGMSYKKAWSLVSSMNSKFKIPLVIGSVGGTNGGGSCLSETGRSLINIYDSIIDSNQEFLKNELQKLDIIA
ncbi:MAG: LysR family transcriptional regulator [Flavobacteriia bacterium]|nr:LysR family transcriptional regulator [Flavobacteriia bacterium]